MNEWVPVKGCIYWGYGKMDPVESILLLLRPRMGYDYTVIQVVCWVKLPEQKRLCPDFCENMDPDKWDTTVWYRVTRNPQEFYGLSTGPPDLGCHITVLPLFRKIEFFSGFT